MDCIERMTQPYVVIAPSYMIYTADYSQFIETHIESGADISMMYHSVDNAKESFLNCDTLNINKQKGVLSIEPNHGTAKNRNIFKSVKSLISAQCRTEDSSQRSQISRATTMRTCL